jgi:hypothetical protein
MGPLIVPGVACRTAGYSTVLREPVYWRLPAEIRRDLEEMSNPGQRVAPEDVIEVFLRLMLPYGRGQNLDARCAA